MTGDENQVYLLTFTSISDAGLRTGLFHLKGKLSWTWMAL